MKHPFNKQRLWLLVSLLCLTIVAGSGLLWHSAQPSPPVSDTYLRYSHVEGIEAAYIRNFQVNDSIFVDVTTLKATTDSAWELLRKDFSIPSFPEELQEKLDAGEDLVSIRMCSSTDPRKPMDSINKDQNHILGFSYLTHTVSIFHTKNMIENKAVRRYNWKV